jgi:hypothetical protein
MRFLLLRMTTRKRVRGIPPFVRVARSRSFDSLRSLSRSFDSLRSLRMTKGWGTHSLWWARGLERGFAAELISRRMEGGLRHE